MKRSGKKTEEWVIENAKINRPKRTKVLVFDFDMRTLKETKQELDSFPFSFRPHKYVNKNLNIIQEVYANIIVWNMDYEKLTTKESQIAIPNNINSVKLVVEFVKQFQNYRPFLFNCNCKESKYLDEIKAIYPKE